MTQPLWSPSPERVKNSLLARYIETVNRQRDMSIDGYDQLWQWSIDDLAGFWQSVRDFTGVVGDFSGDVLRNPDKLLDSEFFPEASLNYAENLLAGGGEGPAVIVHTENGERQEVSWRELRSQVSRLQQALRELGVGPGDRVAGYMPNLAETVTAMLATTSLGAVWSSCSPDFGLNALKDRFGQIEPRVVFTADGYYYNGKTFDSLRTAGELAEQVPGIHKVVVVPYVSATPDISGLGEKGAVLGDLMAGYPDKEPEFARVSFQDPLFILFSSGTTGLPKCIVHSVGGTLLQHLKEHQLQTDLQPGDRLLYFTTCGWMMWNWQVSALASGATLVLYEGNPAYPKGYRLADIVEAEQVTHFGTSAKYLDACAKMDVRPIESHDFAALRTVLSTGSPLSGDGFRYVYEGWKKDICLSSIAGGTDILGCFVGGNPIGPVYAGQCQKRQLGMNVRVFDGEGNSLEGEPGELVCLSPHPSMPIGFLNDPDRRRYFDAYFARFDNVWCHGDWVELTPQGGMIFHGRSDATLNPGGVRIGTAEIYRQVETIEEILEALVIGQEWDNDERVVLFVRLREGVELDDSLVKRIKTEVRSNASPRHVPARIIPVPDIPRTRSGKITELAVRDVVHGRDVKNRASLANPEALEFFRNVPELQN